LVEIFDLSVRVAVVTGASKGMGFAIARTLGAAGATVIISARTQGAAEDAAALLHSEGIEARGVILDVTDPPSVAEFSGDALAAFGRIDVLVLNAAANTPNGSLLSQHPEELGKVMRDNVQANLTIVNAVVPQMVERKDGSLIFMSSRAAKRGSLNLGMYAMAKAPVDQYVRNLALELGPSNINVNSINPGRYERTSREFSGKIRIARPVSSRRRRCGASASLRMSPDWHCCWHRLPDISSMGRISAWMAA
jgi:NAD(P)-dependent dehydrogenase (short-subunit alcohol dehydrogenase family)